MPAIAVDYRKIIQIVAPLTAALVAVAAARGPAQAQSNHMLVIPASDGYGFDDCMGSNKSCGKVIADAWCEAHGMSASTSYARAEDITASIPTKPEFAKPEFANPASAKAEPSKVDGAGEAAPKLSPGSFVVNCRD